MVLLRSAQALTPRLVVSTAHAAQVHAWVLVCLRWWSVQGVIFVARVRSPNLTRGQLLKHLRLALRTKCCLRFGLPRELHLLGKHLLVLACNVGAQTRVLSLFCEGCSLPSRVRLNTCRVEGRAASAQIHLQFVVGAQKPVWLVVYHHVRHAVRVVLRLPHSFTRERTRRLRHVCVLFHCELAPGAVGV